MNPERKEELFNRLISYVCEHCTSNTEEYEAFTEILGFTEEEMIEVGVTDYIDQRNMKNEEEDYEQ